MELDIFTLAGLALVGGVLCVLLKQYKPEYAMLVSVCCGVLLFGGVLASLTPALQTVNGLMQKAAVGGPYAAAIVKALGICYVTQLAADSCRDAGQSAIAGKVELCGRVLILLLSLPLFENLIEIACHLMGIE